MLGLWQVIGRNDVDYDRIVELDLFYIKNWSLWLDVIILMKTLLIVLRERWAYW
jgi:undecaprenyl-phosphate galactose phosphotransferase